jgi:ABC-type multidrug transport system fused ATPase/permease subunit
MKSILQLIPFIKRYKKLVLINTFFNVLTVFFNLVSIPMLIPFLQILLGQEIPPSTKPEWQWQISALTKQFYYQLGQLIQSYGKERALIYVCSAMVLIFFFKNLFRYLSLYTITPMRTGIIRDLRQSLFEKSLNLPLSYFNEERKGDLMSRFAADVQEVEWSILNMIEIIVREPLMIFGSLALMFYISTSLTIFVLLLLVFASFVIGGIGRSLKKESSASQSQTGFVLSLIEEALSGVRVIKAFNAEKYQHQKFKTAGDNLRRMTNKVFRRRDLASPLTEFMGVMIVCILIWYGFKQVLLFKINPNDGVSEAGFIAFIYAFFTVIDPAKSLSTSSFNVKKGAAALERINHILSADEVILESAQAKALPESIGISPSHNSIFKDKIEYRNVSFYYREEDKVILKNINLTIEKGKVVALVGASGAGKSTLADLLPRFYDVSEGEILIDGLNIKDLRLKSLRNMMGIVTQEAVLFNDTIYNNIVFGLENITEQQVIAAAKAANAHDFIENTEGAYQTNIGDRGNKLSGGQRQRLTIARALLRNPEILILDEATSALDSESEKLVQSALAELMKNRTAIVIAHRLSTVQHADEIIVLRAGQIIERGKHESLLVLNGEYRKLVELQGLM